MKTGISILIVSACLIIMGCKTSSYDSWYELSYNEALASAGYCPEKYTPTLFESSIEQYLCEESDALEWTSVESSLRYEVQFSYNSGDFENRYEAYANPFLTISVNSPVLYGSTFFNELALYEEANPGTLEEDLLLYYRVRGIVSLNTIKDCDSRWSEEGLIYTSRVSTVQLVDPPTESLNCDGFPTFIWTTDLLSNATPEYTLQISSDGTFQDVLYTFEGLTQTSFTPENRLLNGDYYWRVANNELYCRKWSETVNKLHVNYIESPPLLSDASNIEACDKSPKLAWETVADCDVYIIQIWNAIDTMTDTTNLIYSYTVKNSTKSTHQVISSLANGTYKYRMQARLADDTCMSAWTTPEQFTILSTISTPLPDSLTGLDDDEWICSTGDINGIISWNSVPEATGYHLQISTIETARTNPIAWELQNSTTWNGEGINPNLLIPDLIVDTIVSTTQFDLSQLSGVKEGELFWRVSGINGDCEGDFSQIWGVNYDYLPTPNPIYPLEGDLVCTLQPQIEWEAIDWQPNESGYYKLEISLNSDFSTIDYLKTPNANFYVFTTNLPGGTYYWRVAIASLDCPTQAHYSTPQQFTIAPEVKKPTPLDPGSPTVVCTPSIDLSWTTLSNAHHYDIRISDTEDFSTILTEATIDQPDSVFNYTFPSGDTQDYYWQVKAYNDECSSVFTDPSILQFEAVPAPSFEPDVDFTVEYVDGGFEITYLHPSFTDNHDYTLILRKIGGYPLTKEDPSATLVYTGDGSSYTDSNIFLDEGVTYYYRAFGCNLCEICAPMGAGASILKDTTPPEVSSFQITTTDPTADTTFNVTMTASDLGGTPIERYLVTESALTPSIDAFFQSPSSDNPITSYNLINPNRIGVIDLYAWVLDEAGNISIAATDSITRDDNTPYGSVVIQPQSGNGTEVVTSSSDVLLDLTYSADSVQMWISGNPNIPNGDPQSDNTNTGWVAVQNTWPPSGFWELCTSCAEQSYTVYVKFKNAVAIESSSAVTDSIQLDTLPPTLSQFLVNNSATSIVTSNSYLELTLNALNGTGSDVEQMRFRRILPAVGSYTSWTEASVGPTPYTLPSASDTYKLEVQIIDTAENTNTFTSPEIILDAEKPTGTIRIDAKDGINEVTDLYTTIDTVDLDITYDANVSAMWISNNATFSGSYPVPTNTGWISPTSTLTDWTISTVPEGEKTVYIRFKSTTNIISLTYSDSIIYDGTAPTSPSPVSTDESSPTNNDTPTWYWYAVPEATAYRYSFIDGSGWTETTNTFYTPASPLSDGSSYTLYVQSKDAAGNWSSSTASGLLTIDTTPLSVPTVFVDVGTVSNEPYPTWTWNPVGGAAGYRYSFTDGSNWVETANTYFTPGTGLGEGNYKLYVQAVDAAGNWSTSGTLSSITIDLTPPDPTVVTYTSTNPTNDVTPTWNWTIPTGADSYRYSFTDGTGWVTTSNTTFTPSTSLLDGQSYTLYVQVRDAAGNWTSSSSSSALLIDLAGPSPPAPVTCSEGDYTQNTNPTWQWNAVSGAVIYRYSFTNGSGWTSTTNTTFSPGSLSDGTYTLYVQAADGVGNYSDSAYGTAVTVDTVAPATPTITTTEPDPTNNEYPRWTWNIVPNSNLYRYSFTGGAPWTETYDINYLPDSELTDGSYTLTVQAGDFAGNWSGSDSLTINVDRTPPGDPTNVTPLQPATTNDPTLDFTWDAVVGADRYRVGFTDDGSGWIDENVASTSWTSSSLGEGTYELYVQAADTAGNWSGSGVSTSVTIDLTPPAAPTVTSDVISSPTNDDMPTWDWNNVADAVDYRYSFTDGVGWTTTGGTTTFTPGSPLSDGSYILYVQASDAVGNWSTSGSAASFDIDTVAPSVPTVSTQEADPTNVQQPTWEWTSSGDAVEYRYSYNAGGPFTITTSTTFTAGSVLSDGIHTLFVQARDTAGNWSTNGSQDITIDTTPPGNVTGLATTEGEPTNNPRPEFTWTTVADADHYLVKYDSDTSWTSSAGTSYTPSVDIPDGARTFYVKAVDAAGNESTTDADYNITIDTIPPSMPGNCTINDGDSNPNDFITNYQGNVTWSWITVTGADHYQWSWDGLTWTTTAGISYTRSTTTMNNLDPYTLHIQAVDAAGNASTSRVCTTFWEIPAVSFPIDGGVNNVHILDAEFVDTSTYYTRVTVGSSKDLNVTFSNDTTFFRNVWAHIPPMNNDEVGCEQQTASFSNSVTIDGIVLGANTIFGVWHDQCAVFPDLGAEPAKQFGVIGYIIGD